VRDFLQEALKRHLLLKMKKLSLNQILKLKRKQKDSMQIKMLSVFFKKSSFQAKLL
jgi:hypothetical protein